MREITKSQINGYRRSVTRYEINWGFDTIEGETREYGRKNREMTTTMVTRDLSEVSQSEEYLRFLGLIRDLRCLREGDSGERVHRVVLRNGMEVLLEVVVSENNWEGNVPHNWLRSRRAARHDGHTSGFVPNLRNFLLQGRAGGYPESVRRTPTALEQLQIKGYGDAQYSPRERNELLTYQDFMPVAIDSSSGFTSFCLVRPKQAGQHNCVGDKSGAPPQLQTTTPAFSGNHFART
ncbi:hypothetical protein EDC04DRAFT_2605528 [Pisolithus marmoratus]|nr:hypothetical protein EDC04DRAFT_2605528 [Pisolithus marmoratus]